MGILIILFGDSVAAQTWNLPTSRANDRFTSDLFVTQRPAMSMDGYDRAFGNDLFIRAHSFYGSLGALD